jgi:hypothetical protein
MASFFGAGYFSRAACDKLHSQPVDQFVVDFDQFVAFFAFFLSVM